MSAFAAHRAALAATCRDTFGETVTLYRPGSGEAVTLRGTFREIPYRSFDSRRSSTGVPPTGASTAQPTLLLLLSDLAAVGIDAKAGLKLEAAGRRWTVNDVKPHDRERVRLLLHRDRTP